MRKLTDLEYDICLWDWDSHKIKNYNLFTSARVLRSVALYRLGEFDKFDQVRQDRLGRTYLERWCSWCFGDVRGRVEWEFGFGRPFIKDDGVWEGVKTDVYTVFCLPNARLLKEMVDKVSVSSCKKWLAEDDKKYRLVKEPYGKRKRKN